MAHQTMTPMTITTSMILLTIEATTIHYFLQRKHTAFNDLVRTSYALRSVHQVRDAKHLKKMNQRQIQKGGYAMKTEKRL